MRRRFGGQQQQRPRTVEVPLKLILKELYSGTTKKLKITRRVFNKATNKLEEKEVCTLMQPVVDQSLALKFS